MPPDLLEQLLNSIAGSNYSRLNAASLRRLVDVGIGSASFQFFKVVHGV
jgi:hypothetical protein